NEVIVRLLRKYGTAPIGITFLDSMLRISEPPNDEGGDEVLRVPAFPDRVINLIWQDGPGKREEKISWQKDSAQPIFVNDISLPASIETTSGETYKISSWQEEIAEIQAKAAPYLVHILDPASKPISVGCMVGDALIVVLDKNPISILAEQSNQELSQY